MRQDELLKKFEEEFILMKEELGFKSSFEDLDKIFFLKDFILRTNFVSPALSRGVCHRIGETLGSWNMYLHNLLMPNPGNMVVAAESQLFDENEKQEIIILMNQITSLISTNNLIGLTKDKKAEAKFIDDSVEFWNSVLNPKLQILIKKITDFWLEKSK